MIPRAQAPAPPFGPPILARPRPFFPFRSLSERIAPRLPPPRLVSSPGAVAQESSNSDPDSDAALLRAFALGEPAAVGEVYQRHARLLARVCARMGAGSPADVEDVVQTTFLEAIRSAKSFQGRSSLRGWLVAIALNQTRLHRRTEGRARRKLAEAACIAETHGQNSEDRELALQRAERIRHVEAALQELPDLQREALVLSEIEGLPAKEIAVLLDAPPATIWRRVHDARKSLRRILGDDDQGNQAADGPPRSPAPGAAPGNGSGCP
jgi:RNA polymerase sigma-70 factor, ECF subfamily